MLLCVVVPPFNLPPRVYEGVYRNPETLEEAVVAVKILKKNILKRRSDCLRFIKEVGTSDQPLLTVTVMVPLG
jgi:hypothetical protein